MKLIKHIPAVGILLFFGLYLVAAHHYPGGSQANEQAIGFDWIHNYWCDLLSEPATNGQPNTARPYAITATLLLCISLAIFFYRFSILVPMTSFWRKTIQVTGLIAMTLANLVFTSLHNWVIIIGSLFGVVTLIGIIKGILQNDMKSYIWTGSVCILLIIITNFLYYTEIFLAALPFIQKITFLVILVWVLFLDNTLKRYSIKNH